MDLLHRKQVDTNAWGLLYGERMEPGPVVAWWLEAYHRGDMTSLALASAIEDLDEQLSPHQEGSRVAVQELLAGLRAVGNGGSDERRKVDVLVARFYEQVDYDSDETGKSSPV